jgi:hypothetical protein
MSTQDDYCGQFTFGGSGFGAVTGNVKLSDGSTWTFAGKMFEIGTPNVGYGNVDCNGFPGESHMEGECSFTIADGGLGPGGFVITFYDLHGGIGTVYGYAFGGGVGFGGGWGYWTKQTGEEATDEQRQEIARKIAEDAELKI